MSKLNKLQMIIGVPSAEGRVLLQRSSTLWHSTLRDKLDRLLAQYEPHFPGELIVPQLELALGDIPAAQFEQQFSSRLLQQLEAWLEQQRGGGDVLASAEDAEEDKQTTHMSQVEVDKESPARAPPDTQQLCQAFIHYLHSGYWPWPALWQQRETQEISPIVAQGGAPGHWLCQQLTTGSEIWLPRLALACLQGAAVRRLHRLLTVEAKQQLCMLFWPDAPVTPASLPLPGVLVLHALHWLLAHPSQQILPAPQKDIIEVLTPPPLAFLRQALHIRLAREEHQAVEVRVWTSWQSLLITEDSRPLPPESAESADARSAPNDRPQHPENADARSAPNSRPQPPESAESADARSAPNDRPQHPENADARSAPNSRPQPPESAESADVPSTPVALPKSAYTPRQNEPVFVAGAGLILCWAMLPALFSRLWPGGMDTPARHQAVILLDWLLWQDDEEMAEWRMTFLRVLCGLALDTALMAEAQPTPEQRQEVSNWLDVMALQLPLPAGLSGVQQLDGQSVRHFFLQRSGELHWQPEGWTLRITQEAQDILLATLPWPLDGMMLSTPLLPWLETPLTIEWPIPELPF